MKRTLFCCLLGLFLGSNVCLSNGPFVDIAFSQNSNLRGSRKLKVPSATMIAKDLKGTKGITESIGSGYFHSQDWSIGATDKVNVKINKVSKKGSVYHYNVTITWQRPSGGKYIMNGRVGYRYDRNKWLQDYFICDKMMPKVTNAYKDFVATRIVNESGAGKLEIKNHSNVKLGVYGVVKYEFNDEIKKFALPLEPNGYNSIGGMFLGSVERYDIHYVERW